MAITVTHIQGEASTNNTQSVVFATSFLPVAGRTYLVVVRMVAGGSLSAATPTVTHGGSGLTLALLAGTSFLSQNGIVAAGQKICAFVGTASGSPTTGVFTTDSGLASNNEGQQYELIELTGVHATTPVPQDDGNNENNTTDGAMTLTLAGAFVDANSFTLSALACAVIDSEYTIPTGWTQLSSRGNTVPLGRLKVAYIAGNDSTADWTGGDTGGTQDLAGFIVEIAAAAGGTDPTLLMRRRQMQNFMEKGFLG